MRLTSANWRRWTDVILIMVLLLALGLRFYRIEAQSLWNDEGTSVALAARDLITITRSAANDIHPPLYYYLLHFWTAAFGNSEVAVRSLSALLGMLVVLMTYALSRTALMAFRSHQTATRSALLAAFFAALSPFHVYYSQETRMYILTALLAALSMYAFMRLLLGWPIPEDRNTGHLRFARVVSCVAYALPTVLLLHTHYFAVSVVLAQNLAFMWWWMRAEQLGSVRQRLLAALRWGGLQVVVASAFLPWLLFAGGQLRVWPAISEVMPLHALLVDVLRVFGLGLFAEQQANIALAGFVLLGLIGLVALARNAQGKLALPPMYVTHVLYLLVPVGVMYLLSLQRPMYNPKFLLLATPPFYLFIAQGILSLAEWRVVRLRAWMRTLLLLASISLVTLLSVRSLQAYYFDRRYARDDYRGIAHYIQAVEEPGDAVLINAPGQVETFDYYYRGDLPLYPLPRQRPLDEMQTEQDLRKMTDGRGRIYAILWATDESDPNRFVEGWLDQHTYKAMDSWYGNVRLVVYATPVQPHTGDVQHPLNLSLGNSIRLLGYDLWTTEVMSGDILQLTLFWEASAPIPERYKVFTHVLDAYGHLVGQRDAEPGGGAKITTVWQEGERITDNYGLPILPATPPGDYTIEIGMYSLDDGQRLPVMQAGQTIADHVVLQSIRVLPPSAPPPLSVLRMKEQLNAELDEVILLGYDLTKLGHEHQPAAPVHGGDILHLTLFWQAKRQPDEDITLTLQLQDAKGASRLERQAPPTEGQYPATRWQPGQVLRDQHNLHLAADLAAGRYRLYLTAQGASSGKALGPRVLVATLAIE